MAAHATTAAASLPESDEVEFVERVPHAALSGWVSRIIGYSERSGLVQCQVEPASLTIPVVLSFGSPFRIGFSRQAPEPASDFVGGLHVGPVVIESTGSASCLQIDLTPAGAIRLLDMPLGEIRDRIVDIGDIAGPEIVGLRRRLADTADWHARFDLAEAFLLRRLHSASTDLPADMAWAYARLVGSGGRARIASLVDGIGCSRRHFTTRFARFVGLRPKEVGRIARCRSAIPHFATGEAHLADIAAQYGFADQAHMTREVAVLSGRTPGALSGR